MFINRRIGYYKGTKPGPLVVALGAVHGNEPAGVQALREVFRLLELEPQHNPDFEFSGSIIGLVGNLSAYITGDRFLVHDLNRLWSADCVEHIRKKPLSLRFVEQRELIALLREIYTAIRETKPQKLILLDLHTTSAKGGIFTIPSDSNAIDIATELHAPVIKGLLSGIGKTLLHFLNEGNFDHVVEGYPKESVGIAFEGGQHDEPKSISRCIAATINCLRAAGCVQSKDVDTKHDAILQRFSSKLPKLLELEYVHHIKSADQFRMRPGYINFQKIQKGEHLADSAHGPIFAKMDGRILMPLYQSRGTDGFFITREP